MQDCGGFETPFIPPSESESDLGVAIAHGYACIVTPAAQSFCAQAMTNSGALPHLSQE